MPYIGNRTEAAGTNPTWTSIASSEGNQRAYLAAATVTSGYLTHVGAWLDKTGGDNSTPRVRFGVWANNNGNPGRLMAYTTQVTVGASTNYEAPLAWSEVTNSDNTALRIPANTRLFLGFIMVSPTRNEATMNLLSIKTGGNAALHKRNGPDAPPTNPFGQSTTNNVLAPAIFAVTTNNTAPTATPTSPVGGGSISSNTPILTGVFGDAESGGTLRDRISAYTLEVLIASSNVQVWAQTYMATAAEQASWSFAQTVTTPLTRNVAYKWRAIAADSFGLAGAWSAYQTFTVTAGGSVDSSSATPAGRQNTGAVSSFGGRWSHPSNLSMNRARVEIYPEGGTIGRSSAEVSSFVVNGVTVSTVSNGSTFTLTASDIAPAGNPLPPGNYTYRIVGRATDNGWSTSWVEQSFRVNFAPNTPVLLSPSSGEELAERPTFYWSLDDRDVEDVVGSNVVAYLELTRAGFSPVRIGPISTVQPNSTLMYYQPTSAQMPAPTGVGHTYSWRVQGWDGYLLGDWSSPRNVVYSPNAIASITSPDVGNPALPDITPVVAWTVSGGEMSKARVYLYLPNAANPFFGSPELVYSRNNANAYPTTAAYTIPVGWLRNGGSYEVAVQITTPGATVSVSQRRQFQVSFAGINPPTGFSLGLSRYDRDFEESSVRMVWDISSHAGFVGYVVRRRLTSDDPDNAVPIAYLRSRDRTGYTDHHAPGNVGLVYSLSQVVTNNQGRRQETGLSEVATLVPLTVPTLVSTVDGIDRRAALMYLSTGISGGYRRTEATYLTWGSNGTPIVIGAPYGYGQSVANVSVTLRTDERGTLQDHFADFERIVRSGDIVCLREERSRMFCRISSYTWRRGDVPGTRTIDLALEEVSYDEARDVIVD